MSPLKTIARDLVERRLWPVAALLAVGLVAVPLMFKRPAPSALEQSSTPAPAAAPTTGGTTVAPAPAGAPTDTLTDPAVELSSSPFAAAFGAPVTLPPAMEGLLKATKGADERKAVADSPLRDPFAVAASAAASASAGAGTGSAAPAASTPASGGSSSGGAGPRAVTVSGGSPDAVPTDPASTTVVPAVDSVPAVPSAPDTGDQTSAGADKAVYKTDVRFGTTDTPPMVADAKRLTAFPSSFQPVAIYLGVMRGGWGAVFAIRDDARPVGAPSCRPRKQICSWVILHPGESVTLNVKDETTGETTPYKLELARIRKVELSESAAEAALKRASVAGRCLLGPLAAYNYDSETGTLAPRPELKACQYAQDEGDGQGETVQQPAAAYRIP